MPTKSEITIGALGVAVLAGAIGTAVMLPTDTDAQVKPAAAVVVVDSPADIPAAPDAGVAAYKVGDDAIVTRTTRTIEEHYTRGGVVAAIAEAEKKIAHWTAERDRFLAILDSLDKE